MACSFSIIKTHNHDDQDGARVDPPGVNLGGPEP